MMDRWEDGARRKGASGRPEGADIGSTRRLTPVARLERHDTLARRRPGSQPFGARLEATRDAVGVTAEDDLYVAGSRALIAAHVDAIADDVYGHLRTRPDFVAQFTDQRGQLDHDRLAAHRDAFTEWLFCIMDDPLDAETGEYLATIGHAFARSDGQLKARYLVETVARVQTLFQQTFAREYADRETLAACSAAWSRRLMVHLDVLLAVYSATQGTPHWY